MREIRAEQLAPGMRLALPMGREATVTDVRVGRQFVTYRFVQQGEHGGCCREIGSAVLLESESESEVLVQYGVRVYGQAPEGDEEAAALTDEIEAALEAALAAAQTRLDEQLGERTVTLEVV